MHSMTGNDLYLRITNSKGESHVQHHRVWDAARLTASITKQHSEAQEPKDRCTVAVASHAEYKQGRRS